MRALAVRRRSIEATKRANSEFVGAMVMAAVLDIGVPFAGGRPLAAS
jgi:hypothetical protein